MALIKTDSQNYTDIANAIREISGSAESYKPSEMIIALGTSVPDYGISYNADGTIATTYGSKVAGFAGTPSNLTVNISEDAKEIGNYAFYESGIRNITLHNGITKIGDYSFSYCDNLTITSLPDNLTEIGTSAFGKCGYFNITSLPDSLTVIGGSAFSETDIAISRVPNLVTEIDWETFEGCSNITSFTVHKNITGIWSRAFASCHYLTTVTFEGTPSKIASNVFEGCSKLTVINVPWAEGAVADAPWGATNATINYNYIVG